MQWPTSNSLLLTIFYFLSIQASSNAYVKAKNSKEKQKARYGKICGQQYPSLDNRGFKIFETVKGFSGTISLEFSSSPQHHAFCWIAHEDKSGTSPTGLKIKERYALATLFFATKPDAWEVKDNWLTKESVCTWFGITCDKWGHVSDIDLGFNGLLGLIPGEIAMLDYLEGLRMTANDLQGVIPTSIGNLSNLKVLQLNMNGFFGMIPTSIGLLSNLRELHLYGNYFEGQIPKEIGNMKNLEILDLYANFLKGSLPKEVANTKKLKGIYLNDNELRGSLPTEICALPDLEFYVADCRGYSPEITCKCCSHCCMDGADPKCIKMDNGQTSKKK